MLPKGYDLADSDFALKVTVTATHWPWRQRNPARARGPSESAACHGPDHRIVQRLPASHAAGGPPPRQRWHCDSSQDTRSAFARLRPGYSPQVGLLEIITLAVRYALSACSKSKT